jgi:biotin-dependent carboxylase-like uncharacterized protein
MFEVLKPGLETSIQDYPGRIGFWNQGFPPSGPMDSWSFRLANLLVGNEAGAAGLEAQYMGPTVKFQRNAVIAVTGADMQPKLDEQPLPMWESIKVRAGQILVLGPARLGVRSYVAIAGGVDTPPWLGSRSTFHKAGVGGLDGHALQAGNMVPVGNAEGKAGRRAKLDRRPILTSSKTWSIEVVAGPNDEWIDEAGHGRFLDSDWKLTAKSDRTGFRLEGPRWTFAERAHKKAPEHGQEPSNIIDQGYPLGAVNLAGRTPIILVNDGPSMGGFINPYTVPSAAFWKLGQSKPGEIYRFKSITVAEAQALRRQLNALCAEDSIE